MALTPKIGISGSPISGAAIGGVSQVAGGIGSLNATEANDTLSATGTVAIAASVADTEANDTLSAAGAVAIVASAVITEANDTLASASGVAITGGASLTEAGDTLASVGAAALAGAVAATEDNDTLLGAANIGATGQLITHRLRRSISAGAISGAAIAGVNRADMLFAFEAADTLSAAGAVAIVGTASLTEANDAIAAQGAVAITAALAQTEADDIAASASTRVIRPIFGVKSGGNSRIKVTPHGGPPIRMRA